ncbi:Drug/metabolite transporter superfamily permease, partial [Pseudomonas syringae pv. syringae]
MQLRNSRFGRLSNANEPVRTFPARSRKRVCDAHGQIWVESAFGHGVGLLKLEQGSAMSTASTPLSGVNQPLKGIGFILLATFLFASHDTLSKYLSGFYPIILVVWARYLVHTLLMACIFMPSSGLRVLRTKRPGLQALRALALLGTSLLF